MALDDGGARQGSLGARTEYASQVQEGGHQTAAADAGRLVAELDVRTRRVMSAAMQGRLDVLLELVAKGTSEHRAEAREGRPVNV